MTVSTVYAPTVLPYSGAGPYPFSWDVISTDGITLKIDGVVYAPANYTLTFNGLPPTFSGGSITIDVLPGGSPAEVQITRETNREQLVNYQPYDPFPAETAEFALDKLTLIAQEVRVSDDTTFANIDVPGTATLERIVIPNAIDPLRGSWTLYHEVTSNGANWLTQTTDDNGYNHTYSIGLYDSTGSLLDFNLIANGTDNSRMDIPNQLAVDNIQTPTRGAYYFQWKDTGGRPHMHMRPTNGYTGGGAEINNAYVTLGTADGSSVAKDYTFESDKMTLPDGATIENSWQVPVAGGRVKRVGGSPVTDTKGCTAVWSTDRFVVTLDTALASADDLLITFGAAYPLIFGVAPQYFNVAAGSFEILLINTNTQAIVTANGFDVSFTVLDIG